MSLPKDTRGAAAGSGFFVTQPGQNKILVLDDAIAGYQYWTEQGVKRSRDVFEDTPGIKQRKDDKTGEMKDEKQQYFWAFPIYNYATKSVEVYQVTQKGVRDQLAAYQANEAWGDPTGKYSLTIDKSGSGLETKYNVVANPDKNDEAFTAIMEEYKASPVDVDEMFFGKVEAPTETAEEAPSAPEVPEEAEVSA